MEKGYPEAPRLDFADDYHGTAVPDPYRWLEESGVYPDDQSDQWTHWRKQWDQAQHELFDLSSRDWHTRDHFAELLEGLLAGGYTGLPVWRGDRCFFTRRDPGAQFPVLHTIDPDGTERPLFDPMVVDPTGLTTLDGYTPSWEGNRMAYLTSHGGTEESVLRVMDVSTGEDIAGPIDRTRFCSIAWLPGEESFFYVRRQPPGTVPSEEEQFHRRVRFHRIGRHADEDEEIFGGGLSIYNYYSINTTRDGRWLTVYATQGTAPRNDVYLADLNAAGPNQPDLITVVERRDSTTSINIRRDGRMFVWTDHEAPRGQMLLASPEQPQPEHWRSLIAEDTEAVLDSYRLSAGPDGPDQYLVLQRTRHTVGGLALYDSTTGELVRDISVPGLGTVAGPTGRPEGGSENWYIYTDHTTPPKVYRYDTISDESALWAQPPGQARIPHVETQQVAYTSADGTEVHMYVISPTSTPSEPRPTILYGYGGFGVPLPPAYSPLALAWVASGGVYAIANIRGGSEEGEEWHRDGMLGNKQNVFDDFHAAAEFLAEEGWTTPDQLCISGGSNGGLLVGAALVQRPELYGSVICTAPLLDMIRYTTSQLGSTWTVEYGDPADPEQFEWLWSYSPYHNVEDGENYPAVLMVIFDNDTRTDPMHGRKMVAELQHKTVGGCVVLRTEADVGHGARSLDRSVAESADSLAFAAHSTELKITD
ncbi:MAG: S9 family peptidase [Micrococcales bacterium]|nr:S9 family peptidase [Micrococcales bacterium]